VHDVLPHAADFELAQRCLEGQGSALKQLQDTYRPIVMGYLRKHGASESEVLEMTDSLWTDLISERKDRRPRLANYAGKAALGSWLYPLAVNRLKARRDRENVESRIVERGLEFENLAAAPGDDGCEPLLIELMKEAIEFSFRECTAEDFVKLQLSRLDNLHLNELALMFGCSPAKMGRDVNEAKDRIEKAALGYIRKKDPWLDLTWNDFMELCRVATPACFGTD
jgi:DNA-directed RNA polymerase specialized sigma24 family protein